MSTFSLAGHLEPLSADPELLVGSRQYHDAAEAFLSRGKYEPAAAAACLAGNRTVLAELVTGNNMPSALAPAAAKVLAAQPLTVATVAPIRDALAVDPTEIGNAAAEYSLAALARAAVSVKLATVATILDGILDPPQERLLSLIADGRVDAKIDQVAEALVFGDQHPKDARQELYAEIDDLAKQVQQVCDECF